jgi:hypothetical protein
MTQKKKPFHSRLSLSPLEGFIVKTIADAGSEDIVTIVVMIHNRHIVQDNILLSELASAIQNLLKFNYISLSTIEYSNYQQLFVPFDQVKIKIILDYLNTCSWENWWFKNDYGYCDNVEICER